MENNKVKTLYSKRVWLNKEDSPSTGSMVAYDGIEYDGDEVHKIQTLKITDCYNTVRLHKAHYDTENDFLNKVILIRDELNLFIKHLRSKQE